MALTYTPSHELGARLPEFELKTVEGQNWSSTEIVQAPAKVIVFMCNHCPYVKAIEGRLISLGRDLKKLEVPLIGICSNDPSEYPEDGPEQLLLRWREKKYEFTYLVDETQAVARSFGAVCTPDFFVYDGHNRLTYRGRLDDSWRDESKVTRRELKLAVEKILSEKQSSTQIIKIEQVPSMGCSIKWKHNHG
jgi:peroxiredoxin